MLVFRFLDIVNKNCGNVISVLICYQRNECVSTLASSISVIPALSYCPSFNRPLDFWISFNIYVLRWWIIALAHHVASSDTSNGHDKKGSLNPLFPLILRLIYIDYSPAVESSNIVWWNETIYAKLFSNWMTFFLFITCEISFCRMLSQLLWLSFFIWRRVALSLSKRKT